MKTKDTIQQKLWTPWQYFVVVLVIIFVAEVGVMYLLPLILPPDFDSDFEAFCDAGILTILSAPILWLVLIRPLRAVASEEALKYTMIVEEARDAIFTVDDRGVIESINSASELLLGAQAARVLGQPLDVILGKLEKRSSTVDSLRKAASSTDISQETFVTDLNGNTKPVELTVSALTQQGKCRYTLIIRDISYRKQSELELAEVNRKLIDSAHVAGKAEIATSVLHNVGNVLTSINVIATTLNVKVRDLRITGVQKAAELFQSHEADLTEFLTKDQRGQQLPTYLVSLADALGREQQELTQEVKQLTDNLEHVNKIVAAQQDFARNRNLDEVTELADLIDSAISVAESSLERHAVVITKQTDDLPQILIDRHKLLQILVNLLNNAKEAVSQRPAEDRRVKISLGMSGSDRIRINIRDNGVGIESDQLTQIFAQGFTTKNDGHGFGLHYSGLAVKELGGFLSVCSDGVGTGSTFTVDLPMHAVEQEVCQ